MKQQQYKKNFDLTVESVSQLTQKLFERSLHQELDLISNLGGVENIMEGLRSNTQKGINFDSIEKRKESFGSNNFKHFQELNAFKFMLEGYKEQSFKDLIVYSIVSLIIISLEFYKDATNIQIVSGMAPFFTLFIICVISGFVYDQKQKEFVMINNVTDQRKFIEVIRDGQQSTIHQNDLVVGDIVIIQNGLEVPADGLLLEGDEVIADESNISDDSYLIAKQSVQRCQNYIEKSQNYQNTLYEIEAISPILLKFSVIVQGQGKMLVLAVGQQTFNGMKAAPLQIKDLYKTKLQEKIYDIGSNLRGTGSYLAVFVFVLLIIVYLIIFIDINLSEEKNIQQLQFEIVTYYNICLGMIVAVLPEGIIFCVTIAYYISNKNMLQNKNLIRTADACENMSQVTDLIVDVAGIITKDDLNLTSIWNQSNVQISNDGEGLENQQLSRYIPSFLIEDYINAFIVNSNIQNNKSTGQSLDLCLQKFMKQCGYDYDDIKSKAQVQKSLPYTNSRKRSTIVVKQGDQYVLYMKGSSSVLMNSCTKLHNFDDQVIEIDSQQRAKIKNAIINMSKNQLRTFIIAKKTIQFDDFQKQDQKGLIEGEKDNLTLIGILGMSDPLRPDIVDQIFKCKKAGLKIRLMTEENRTYAKEISIACGNIAKNDHTLDIMNAADFIDQINGLICQSCRTHKCSCPTDYKTAFLQDRHMREDTVSNQEEFVKIGQNLAALSRADSNDKYALLIGLNEINQKVAVSGESNDDCNALYKSFVGISTICQGNNIVIEASDILQIEKQFDSILNSIFYGRLIYDHVRKFLQFQITYSICALIFIIFSIFTYKTQVLTTIQLTWINLILNVIAAIALSTEPINESLYNRKPSTSQEDIITIKMYKHILIQVIYQLTILILCLCFGQYFFILGEKFIPEFQNDDLDIAIKNSQLKYSYPGDNTVHYIGWSGKYSNPVTNTLIRSGRHSDFFSTRTDYNEYLWEQIGASRHLTFIFNLFVVLQLFNLISCRYINDEINVLYTLFTRPKFLLIWLFMLFLQFIAVTFGNDVFASYKWAKKDLDIGGLDGTQWLLCCCFGGISLIVNLIVKLIPDKLFESNRNQKQNNDNYNNNYNNNMIVYEQQDVSQDRNQQKENAKEQVIEMQNLQQPQKNEQVENNNQVNNEVEVNHEEVKVQVEEQPQDLSINQQDQEKEQLNQKN